MKKLSANICDFTNAYFQLIFTFGKNKILPWGFDYTIYKREKYFISSLQTSSNILLSFSTLV